MYYGGFGAEPVMILTPPLHSLPLPLVLFRIRLTMGVLSENIWRKESFCWLYIYICLAENNSNTEDCDLSHRTLNIGASWSLTSIVVERWERSNNGTWHAALNPIQNSPNHGSFVRKYMAERVLLLTIYIYIYIYAWLRIIPIQKTVICHTGHSILGLPDP